MSDSAYLSAKEQARADRCKIAVAAAFAAVLLGLWIFGVLHVVIELADAPSPGTERPAISATQQHGG